MVEVLIEFLSTIPTWLATFVLAMLPITELRGSIPIGIDVFQLPVWQAWFWSFLGNLVPALVLILGLPTITEWADKHWKGLHRILLKIFARTERKLSRSYQAYGTFALLIFVAIPLPLSGVWTGSVAGFLFQIKKRNSLIAVITGMLIASVLVVLINQGILNLFGLI